MKCYSFKVFITLFFLSLSGNLLMGQSKMDTKQVDHTQFTLLKTITLNGGSDQVEVSIPISDRKVTLSLTISSSVWAGELTIEVYDPKGEKLGNYSVGSQNSIHTDKITSELAKTEAVRGQITKSIEHPESGIWKVLIIPKNAKGTLDIRSNQSSVK